MRQKPEILAPVGSEDALIAAVRSGADAVYFGAGECNARRGAGRFEGEALDRAVRYCHARNVRVYVTVNTLLRDEELQSAADSLCAIAKSGADGIIIQDLAVARLAKEICPSLERHASTQMAVHNAAGANALAKMGFSRVVLARELTGREIRAIREQTDVELEVFLHGALCMSVSGMCFLSASLGERSGNRGTCAQPCRLPFSCGNNRDCLSLKDMSHLSYFRELAEIGVASCKIEGRLKRPEYVAAATNAACLARDGAPYETDSLAAVFSRSGFTDGYYTGKRDRRMFGTRTREDADRSKDVLASFRELYRKERASVPIDATLSLSETAPTVLTVSDGTHTVSVEGEPALRAKTAPATEESLRAGVAKTGGTPFVLQSFHASIAPGTMLPASALNALRRTSLDRLLALREAPPERAVTPVAVPPASGGRHAKAPKLFVRFATAKQQFSDARIFACSLPADELLRHPDRIGETVWCELPALCWPGEEPKLVETLRTLSEQGVRDAVAGNIGTIRLAKEAGMRVHGGYGLNVANRLAAAAYAELGLVDLTVSFELPFAKMRDLSSHIPLGCIVAGRLPLMQFRSCPARSEKGCGACSGAPTVTDRTGRSFPLVCHARQYTTMLNSVPYYAADKRLPELDFYTVYCTTESREEAQRLTEAVLRRDPPTGEHTTGMSFRVLL